MTSSIRRVRSGAYRVTTPAPHVLRPGWYDDPTGRHGRRWWSGRGWTHYVDTPAPKNPFLSFPWLLLTWPATLMWLFWWEIPLHVFRIKR